MMFEYFPSPAAVKCQDLNRVVGVLPQVLQNRRHRG